MDGEEGERVEVLEHDVEGLGLEGVAGVLVYEGDSPLEGWEAAVVVALVG